MAAITARDVTAAMRTLYPAPVRLAVRADGEGLFLLRLPSAPAYQVGASLAGYLGRRLGCQVTVTTRRQIRRRDCGHDVEFAVHVHRALLPCGCLKNEAGAHRVGCPDHPQGVRP
jgi:hypothetical protein